MSVLVACGPALAACARSSGVSRESLVGWESGYEPAPQCRLQTRLGSAPGDAGGRTGSLVVVVVDAANFYVVYDPAEPVALGEYNEWLVIDRRFRVLARLAL